MAGIATASRSQRPSRYHGVAMTLEGYLALPEEQPYLEYLHGRVQQKPMASIDHGQLEGLFFLHLRAHGRATGGRAATEVHVRFEGPGEVAVLVPDVSYWTADRLPQRGAMATPPTLAVEVRSEGQPMAELREKCRLIRRHGVEVCWLVDPFARTVEVFDQGRDGERASSDALTSPALPGHTIPLTAIWAEIDEH